MVKLLGKILHMEQTAPRSSIRLWSLYDFANSIGFVVVSFYFVPWFIAEQDGSDLEVSTVAALSTVIMLCTLPIFGAKADTRQRSLPWLRSFTFSTITFLGLLALFGSLPKMHYGVLAAYFFFQYFYQSSLAFYNSLLQRVSGGRSLASVSGIGIAVGQFGNVIGLLAASMIIQRDISFIGLHGVPAAFIVCAILFLLCVLPSLFCLKENSEQMELQSPATSHLHSIWKQIKHIRTYPSVLSYLCAYYLFADAVLTLTLFGSYYLLQTGLNEQQKTIALLLGIILGIVGSALSGWFVKKTKNIQTTLQIFILLWVVLLLTMAFARTPLILMAITALNGFAYATLFALSRAYYAQITPANSQATFFSVYVLFERAASILGPLLWSGVALLFASYGPDRYRFSIASLAVLVLISWVVFRYVHAKNNRFNN